MVISDAAVISRVRSGEAEAFALLVERYQARCARFAIRLLGDSDDAADAVQDAFVRAYLSLDRYEDRDRFGAWLLCIVANRCHTMADSARRRARIAAEWCRMQGDAVHEDARGDHALAARLEHALSELAPDTRAVVMRKYADERTYEEIASDTGVAVSALKMRVARGSAHLRQVLAGTALTIAIALLVVATHRPSNTERRPAAAVACDTLRTLMHDTLSQNATDSMLPAGRCGADSTAVKMERPLHAPRLSLQHSAL